MGDSDEEHEKGRRGKFRRERGDNDDRSRMGRDSWERRRESWDDRDRGRRREYDRGPRRGRRDGSPPYKRMKRDWDDGFYPYDMPFMRPPGPWGPPMQFQERDRSSQDHDSGPTLPPLLTFRQFLNSQEEEIGETVSVEKYAQYKKDFHRKAVQDFFEAHKEEDWLRSKYHPVDNVKWKEEQKQSIERRKKVFFELMDLGWIDKTSLDIENSNNIIKLLDAVMILLEGGTSFDLSVLETSNEEKEEAMSCETDKEDKMENQEEPPKEPSGETVKGEGKEENGSPLAPAPAGAAASENEQEAKPRPLHQIKSLYIRTIAPHIKKADIVEFAEKVPGYLRTGLAEPQTDRRFHSRGWITFDHTVDIKETCSKLNNTKVGDFELNMIVNRDLTHRVRHVSGFSVADIVARKELSTAIKLMQYFDQNMSVWNEVNANEKNPLVTQLESVLEMPEPKLEEKQGEGEDEKKPKPPQRNDELLKALDKAVFYLRLVHSLDFYDAKEYSNEDSMPNRCNIFHVRGLLPSKSADSDVEEYLSQHLKRLEPFFSKFGVIQDEEAHILGLKDEDKEVEAFLVANTQELTKDKWLCPLSGKKFRGPEFIRKHILNKHADKVQAVRNEVRFLEQYIRDPHRPQLPASSPDKGPGFGRHRHSGGSWPRPPPYIYGGNSMGRLPISPEMFPGRRGRRDPRGLREYHDLDAPEEMDF